MNRIARISAAGVVVAVFSTALRADGTSLEKGPRTMQAPTVAPVGDLPQVERLCQPETRTLVGYTRRVLRLTGPDADKVAVFSYSNLGPANWLFIISTKDGSVERFEMPNNEQGSHGAALGSDGNIYVMPYDGHAWKFDVAKREFVCLGKPLPEGEYTWDAIGASNGRIYFGTYPSAIFGEYDIAANTFWFERHVVENTKYVVGLSERPDGKIALDAWAPDHNYRVFDPKTRTFSLPEPAKPAAPAKSQKPSPASPQLPEGDTAITLRFAVPHGPQYVLTTPSSRIFEMAPDGSLTLMSDELPKGESWRSVPCEDAFCGISMLGVFFRFDPDKRTLLWKQLPNQSPWANAIMFLEAASPGCAVGAHYSQMNIFTVDPETGEWQDSNQMISRVTGEPMCAIEVGGRLYVGIYVSCLISVFDPTQPIAFGENPREIVEVGRDQHRPMAMATDGRRVFMASHANYGKLPGALTVLDTQTEQVETFTDVVPEQNLESVAYDPVSGLVVGGSYRWGDCQSHPATQPSAVIFAWDPETKKTVQTAAPWPGADAIRVLDVTAEGVGVAVQGGEVLLFDPKTLGERYRGAFPLGSLGALRRSHDGSLVGLAGGKLFRWDTAENVVTTLADAGGCRFVCQPKPGLFLLADSAAVHRFREEPRQ